MNSVTFEIKEHLLTIQESGKGEFAIELNLISFNEGAPKYDLRRWNKTNGYMFKGVRLTREEAEAVAIAIINHLNKTKEA